MSKERPFFAHFDSLTDISPIIEAQQKAAKTLAGAVDYDDPRLLLSAYNDFSLVLGDLWSQKYRDIFNAITHGLITPQPPEPTVPGGTKTRDKLVLTEVPGQDTPSLVYSDQNKEPFPNLEIHNRQYQASIFPIHYVHPLFGYSYDLSHAEKAKNSHNKVSLTFALISSRQPTLEIAGRIDDYKRTSIGYRNADSTFSLRTQFPSAIRYLLVS